MKKLKINELEEGKIYRFYYDNGILLKNIYMINKQGELYCGGDKYYKNKNGFSQSSLIYNAIINGYFVEIKREIDWSKVPRGTKVQVKDIEKGSWRNAYFSKFIKENEEYSFRASFVNDDKFTGLSLDDSTWSYKYCRIHESVEIPDEWYKEVRK